jgi:chloride channel protein, CIC family
VPTAVIRLLPNRIQSLRLLVHTRKIVGVMLPLGAGIGFMVALALKGLGSFEPWVSNTGGRIHLAVLLPGLGLGLATLWLHLTKIGEVSLFEDLDLARKDPYKVFPFWTSLGKVMACTLTIGFGGSAGVEGPGKWLGAAIGLQYHRIIKTGMRRAPRLRHFLTAPMVMVRAGAAAALSSVFRAPLSGALMAAEHHGRVSSEALIPCLVSAASGYVVFAAWMGHAPLLPLPQPYVLRGREIFWALILGLVCGLAATVFLWLQSRFKKMLNPLPLPWRGLVAGAGLVLLALPGHFFWNGLPITLGGGLELIQKLLLGHTLPTEAVLFLSLKLVATALTFAGGGVGGLWLPSIAMGAAIGASFDAILGLGQPGYMTLVGASALAGATHETLLVPCVFLAETTAQAALVVPALVGTAVSYLVVQERI